tara:strand:+ start:300 stop:881 length:582 start_codon:yes stop_codon:yes gene_type:complete
MIISVMARRITIYTAILLWLFAGDVYAMPDMKKAFSEVTFFSSSQNEHSLNTHKGKVLLVFFGYTHCPDICPTTMLDIRKSLQDLGENSEDVQPIFISVDYKRDTPEIIDNYVKFFDKRIIGLTGSKEMLGLVSKSFKTSYALLDSKNTDNYLVEHSSNLFIIDRELVVRRIIPNGLPHSEITKTLKELLDID